MSRFAMSKINLSRRQFVNVTAAASGRYAIRSGNGTVPLGVVVQKPQRI